MRAFATIMASRRQRDLFRFTRIGSEKTLVVVQLTSSEKIEQVPPSGSTGIVESLFNPLGIAGKVFDVQELQYDNTLSFVHDLLGEDQFELIRFIYRPSNDKKLEASVSFHLTQQEKEDVLNALKLEVNKNSMQRLKAALGGN